MARLAIHIDGAYVGKLAENEFRTWFDYEKLSAKIKSNIAAQTQEPLDLVRTYFYDCLPYQSDPPTSDEARRFGNRRKFFHALRQLPTTPFAKVGWNTEARTVRASRSSNRSAQT